jgi:hypothetical protein
MAKRATFGGMAGAIAGAVIFFVVLRGRQGNEPFGNFVKHGGLCASVTHGAATACVLTVMEAAVQVDKKPPAE